MADRNRTADPTQTALVSAQCLDRIAFGCALQSCYVTCNLTEHIMSSTARSASRDKVRAHRTRLRDRGLRPVQIWVADVRSRAFTRAAHRQSLAVANSSHAEDDQAFVDAISLTN